jgi:serine/threonine protein kinase/TPR repeat protein
MNRIGQYEIRELLGEGGIGKVHAAIDTELDREVAIKSLRPELANDDSFVKRFRTEAKNLANLNHPNITTLYSLFTKGSNLYMIMELVRGQTLDHIISERKAPLGANESLAIIAQACDGLAYAHSMGVIHRDIKPANLMVTKSGLLKVMDFGIARARGSQRLTRDGSIVGTLAYMAPEQLRGQEGDERSDIYSLAILLYEMFNGAPPFSADTDYDLMQAQINDKPERLGSRVRGLNPNAETALMTALSKKPEQRFSSMQEFSEALGASALKTSALKIVHDQTRVIDALPIKAHRRSRLFVALENSSPGWLAPVVSGIEAGVTTLSGLSTPRWLSRIFDIVPLPVGIRGPVVTVFLALIVVGIMVFAPTTNTPTTLSKQKPQQLAPQSTSVASAGTTVSSASVPTQTREPIKTIPPKSDDPNAAQLKRTLGEISSAMGRKDFAKSIEIAQPLAETGNKDAQMVLGYLYETGSGVKQSDEESVYWYRKAAEQRHVQAQYNLGLAYEYGRGVTKNNFEAVRWYKQAAEQGHANSQNRLGIMYALGRGVDQDYAQAVAWYRKSADQKSPNAQKNLGDMYALGRGVLQDDREAIFWYREAAAQKYADAEFNIGWWYENGRNVQADPKIAADWYRKAQEHGYSEAQAALNRLRASGYLKD